ncbi:MAG: type II toxin-antitoxin system RelE/ParE family toxin [Nitrospinae bacterium]|nr:type II toxin-antitoxin system RelE/ParE family toxin [Nitrospinota bacterium]
MINLYCHRERDQWTNKARRQLKRITTVSDRLLIVEKVETLAGWPEVSQVKNLVNQQGYRMRVGDWRIIFSVEAHSVLIVEVKRRNEQTY